MILGIIPARGGSKGVPDKNIKKLGGKSLIHLAAEVGLQSNCDHVVLSTDSERYAAEGRRAGVDVFMRPKKLAGDKTAMLDVIQHVVAEAETQWGKVNTVVLLQPTSPFRTSKDLTACLRLFEKTNCDSVVSVIKVPDHYSPYTMMVEIDNKLDFPLNPGYKYTRRQDMPQAYLRNGAFYVFKRSLLKRKKPTFFGKDCRKYLMDAEITANIDGPEDFAKAKKLWKLFNK